MVTAPERLIRMNLMLYTHQRVIMSIPSFLIDGLGAEKLEGAFRRPKKRLSEMINSWIP